MAKILVMEDEFDQADLLLTILSSAGHEVTLSHDGDEAWSLLLKEPYDVLLTDMSVKSAANTARKAGGLALIGKIRAVRGGEHPEWIDRTRIVAISGVYTIAENMLRMAHTLGADVCLRKPASINDLLDAVEPDRPRAASDD